MAQPGLTVCRWALRATCWLSSAHQLRFVALLIAQLAGPLLDAVVPEGCSCATARGLLAGAACLLLYLYYSLWRATPFLQVAPRLTISAMGLTGELKASDRSVRNAG